MSAVRIVIFAKAPLPGLAKTRLIPALGAAGAARLALKMLEHTAHEAQRARLGPVELCATPAPADAAWRGVLDAATEAALVWHDQGEGDLGARLARAGARITARGEAMLFIGSDCPGMTAAILRQSAQELAQHDAVLIPSIDAGYVLLGLRRSDPTLFAGIAWSTPKVAEATRARLRALNWRWAEQPALCDIDEPADLAGLPRGWAQ